MAKAQRISAVIISFYGIDFISACLKTLSDNLSDYTHEIIIVDNHSTDGTIEYIEANYPQARIIKNSANLGFARAVNQGIEASRFEYIWLLNQDIRIRSGCLNALLHCMDTLERPGIVGPKFVGFDGVLQKMSRRFPHYHNLLWELTGMAYLFHESRLFNGWKMGDFNHLESGLVEQPMGAAMLIRRECIDSVGLLDESFTIFFNDVDYCRRIIEAGYTNYYCAEAIIEHYVGGSVSKRKPRMVWVSHVGMYKYFAKWEGRRKSSFAVKLLHRPLLYLAGLMLVLSAIPRSVYHYVRSFIG
jgi:GT2 family glycosyltransferase